MPLPQPMQQCLTLFFGAPVIHSSNHGLNSVTVQDKFVRKLSLHPQGRVMPSGGRSEKIMNANQRPPSNK
jgi:hypothetical protein